MIDEAGRTTMGLVKISVSADVTLPTVSISSPLGGTVSGSVVIKASASDNAGVTGVTFFDGAFPIATVSAAPFETAWATTLVANGSHTLTAIARDAAGNAATSSPVTVNVSNVVMVNVPGVVGMTETAAQSAIATAGLVVGTANATNDAAPAGTVIAQSPAAGTSVATGSSMTLTVSLGPAAPATVIVPSVVNLTQAAASTALTGAGLTTGAVTTATSATVASGSVISQLPVAGASALIGSQVALVVSSGPPAPDNGLVLAFGFEEASGNPVLDSSSAPRNGTILGATRVAAGKIGRALSFDGVDDWVTVTDTTASKIDLTNGMTLEAWVNPTAMSGWETVLLKERGVAGTGLLSYALYAHDGAPQSSGFVGPAGYIRPAPANSTTDQGVRSAVHTAIPLGAWTHLATTYDGANQRFYVNGVLVATKAQTGNIAAGNQALRIGGNAVSGEYFKGLIDEVRIYNRALSAAEITTDMTTPVVP
jgi:hypothetical protein